ncbi:hypothetical protein Acsp02_23190 [Actinoplanes sp. NBRC 103695]|nr:hypothetical protein Acsp02_23190 [Actinoplanes sp. NBRC 103695]
MTLPITVSQAITCGMPDVALVDRMRPGDHVCWTFADDRERRRVAGGWVRAGLRDHHLVVYRTGAPDALAELADERIDTRAAIGSGRLRVLPVDQNWLVTGAFDADAADQEFAADLGQALHSGYAGLRAVADMGWAARRVPGAEQLGRYERRLNRRIADGYAMALCLYDRRLFAEPRMSELTRAHPASVTERSTRYGSPLLRMVRCPGGLRLFGEADLSNRDAFAAVLGHLLEDSPAPDVTLDLTELRFADATSCRLVVTVARDSGGRVRTTGARPSLRRLLTLQGAHGVPGLLPPVAP